MAIFKKLFDQIREWLGVVPKKIREYSSRSLEITSKIKNLLGGPLGDAVVNIIPGTWDDSVRTLLLGYLNEAIPYLQIVDTCKGETEVDKMIVCWVKELQKHPKHIQDALLLKLAALLTALQDGKQLKMSLYDFYTQAEYSGGK